MSGCRSRGGLCRDLSDFDLPTTLFVPKRKLAMFLLLGDLFHLPIKCRASSFLCQLDHVVVSTNQLQAAWKARHPDIALELCQDEKHYYPIHSARELDAWCDLTFQVETSVQ